MSRLTTPPRDANSDLEVWTAKSTAHAGGLCKGTGLSAFGSLDASPFHSFAGGRGATRRPYNVRTLPVLLRAFST